MAQNVVRIKLAGVDVEIRQAGTTTPEKAQLQLQGLKVKTQDLKPVWLGFEPIWRQQNARIFASGGIPPWPALSPAYAARKYAAVGAMPIMVYSGRLRASLAAQTADSVYVATPRSLRIGTAVPYSRYHNATRPHVVMLPETLAELTDLITDYLTAGIQ